jgi:hypothetical protein
MNKASKRDPTTEPKQTPAEEKSVSVSTSHDKLIFQVRDSPGFRGKKDEILGENFKVFEL